MHAALSIAMSHFWFRLVCLYLCLMSRLYYTEILVYQWVTRRLPWLHWFLTNRATKSAFYDRIYKKFKGL